MIKEQELLLLSPFGPQLHGGTRSPQILFIFLKLWLIECGFPGMTLFFSSRVKSRVAESFPRRIGK